MSRKIISGEDDDDYLMEDFDDENSGARADLEDLFKRSRSRLEKENKQKETQPIAKVYKSDEEEIDLLFESPGIPDIKIQSPDEEVAEDPTIEKAVKMFSSNIKGIVTGIVIIAVALFLVFAKSIIGGSNGDKTVQDIPEEMSVSADYRTMTETVWGTKATLDYTEFVTLPDNYYSDSMVVTKFIMIDGTTSMFYFSGIPMHYKKKIIFPVTVSEYNAVPSGGKIFIDYRIVKINGEDKITDISTSIKE